MSQIQLIRGSVDQMGIELRDTRLQKACCELEELPEHIQTG